MKGNNPIQQGRGTSCASPSMLEEFVLKVTSLLACLTREFGQNLKVLVMKDLVHLQRNGRAVAKISLVFDDAIADGVDIISLCWRIFS